MTGVLFDGTDDHFAADGAQGQPDSDWSVGIFTHVTANAGTGFQHIFSTGGNGENSSINLWLIRDGEASNPGKWFFRCTTTENSQSVSNTATGGDSIPRLVVLARDDDRLRMYFASPGVAAEQFAQSGLLTALGAIAGADPFTIGNRASDLAADRWYASSASRCFMLNRLATIAEMSAVANGISPEFVFNNSDLTHYFPLNSASVTQDNYKTPGVPATASSGEQGSNSTAPFPYVEIMG